MEQVNLTTSEGDVGVLANHVPSIFQLVPGSVEIIQSGGGGGSKTVRSFFVSGGFVTINPDSSMQIAAMEAVPLDQLDTSKISDGLQESLKKIQATNSLATNDINRVEAQIHNQVYQALTAAVSKR